MTIITEPGLYPELAIIEDAIKNGQSPRKQISYAPYASVLIPFGGFYYPLAALAAYYGNERTFDLFLAMPHFDPNATELCNSTSLLRVLLGQIFNHPAEERIKYKKMLNALLKNKKLDLSLSSPLYQQTPLHYLAGKGDKDLSLIEKMVTPESDFSADLYGAHPLFISLQEAQYKTTQHILATADKSIVMRPRIDGVYPIEAACRFSTDLVQGTALIKQLLGLVNPEFLKKSKVLFSVSANKDSACRLKFFKILLAQGADPNVTNTEGDHLLIMIAGEIFRITDAQEEERLLEIVDILLQHGANIFFKVINNTLDFVSEMSRSTKGRRMVQRILNHFKTDTVTFDRIMALVGSEAAKKKNGDDERHIYFENRIYEIATIPDERAQAVAILKLKSDLANDWNPALAQDDNAQYRKSAILARLIDFYNRGFLSAEGILEVIKTFKGMQGIYKSALPYLYREYLVRSLVGFSSSGDRGKSVSYALMIATQFLSSFDQQQDEDRLCFINEFNDIIQRIILLALAEAKSIHGHFEACLTWLNKMPEECFDTYSQLLILELKITQAYYQGRLQEFNQYVSRFPSDHILQRQYIYWQTELLFRHSVGVSTVESIYELEQALNNLQQKYPDIPASYKKYFIDKLTAYRLQVASTKASQKPVKKITAALPTITPKPVSLPAPAPYVSNNDNNNNNAASSSSSVSQVGLILNQTKTTTAPDSTSAPVKAKRRHNYVARNAEVMEELAQQANPHRKKAMYTEAQVREKFKAVLQHGDILKPLSYDNEEGICWAVCRAREVVHDKLAEHFEKKFAESYRVKFGHVDSGMCCEKEKNEKKGVIRLKLGHHDERLHGPIYRPAVIEGEPIDRCFLVVLNTRWVHGQAFEQEDIYLDPPVPMKQLKNGLI